MACFQDPEFCNPRPRPRKVTLTEGPRTPGGALPSSRRSAFGTHLALQDEFDRLGRSMLSELRQTLSEFQSDQLAAYERQEALLQQFLERERAVPGNRRLSATDAAFETNGAGKAGAELPGAGAGKEPPELEPAARAVVLSRPSCASSQGGFVNSGQPDILQRNGGGASSEQNLQRAHKVKSGVFNMRMRAMEETCLDEEMYDVQNFYRTEGCAQAIARNDKFGHLTLFLIAINALYMGVDAQLNTADTLSEAEWQYQLAEHFFCAFFLFEWLVRFLAFRRKRDCLKDFWFKFDTALVMMMVGETWVMLILFAIIGGTSGSVSIGPLRLLRLLRLARMTRLMRAMPELMTMVKGMRVASRAVTSSLLMLLLLVYVYAIALLSFLREEEGVAQYFSSLSRCMWTLLMDGTFMDSTGSLMHELLERDKYHIVLIFMSFVLLSSMTMMNMLIGVLCEVVSAVAAAEREEAAISLVKQTLLVMLKRLDTDGSQTLTREELFAVIHDPASLQVLLDLKVDVPYLLEFQNMLFEGHSNEIPIRAIMDLILSSRGDRAATVQDIIDASSFTHFLFTKEMCQHEARMAELFQRAPRAETK